MALPPCLRRPRPRARDWPEKTVTWVLPFPAGGPSDGFARTLAELVGAELGQTVVIDNKSGAGGSVGAAVVSHAAPDGYTMLVGFTGNAYAPLIYANPGFDLLRDFAPISAIDRVQSVLLVNPKRLDVASLAQFLDSRARQARVDRHGIGRAGHGGASRDRAAADRREDQAAPRALSRRRAGAAGSAGRAGGRPVRHRRPDGELRPDAGALRALAVAGRRREPLLPDVPTFKEAGLGDFRAVSWDGLFAPKATPAPVLDRMHAAVQKALAQREGEAAMGRTRRARRAREPRRVREVRRRRTAPAGAPSSRPPASSRSDHRHWRAASAQ